MRVLTLLFVATAVAAAQTPPQPAPAALVHTASLSGVVTRATQSGPAIGGARVVAARVGGPISEYRTAITSDAGRFAFSDLAAGSFRIFVEHENYLQTEFGSRVIGGAGTPIAVIDGQAAGPITIAMTPPGAIAGRVVDRGQPARLIWVRALKPSYFDGVRSFRIAAWAQTDDRGEFRLFGLTPGPYIVSAMPYGKPRIVDGNQVTPLIPSTANGNTGSMVSALTPEILDAAALDSNIYPAVYHPGTTDVERALSIAVRAGETAAGISLSIVRVVPHAVRGRVVSADGQPVPTVRVGVGPLQDGTFIGPPSVETRDGAFEIPRVAPGRYYLSVRSQAAPPAQPQVPLRMGLTAVDVGNADLDNVTITLKAAVTVTGTVTIDGRVPVATDGPISVQLQGGPGLPGSSAVRIQPDGTFTIPNVAPQDYRFRMIQIGHPMWVRTARFGADDVVMAPIHIDGELRGRQLDIVISGKSGSIDVTVIDRDQKPVAGALVVAVPDPARRGRSSYYKSGTTDALGRLHLEDVAPGDYKLFVSNVEAAAWQDPDFLRAEESHGVVVRLVEGGGQVVTLRWVQ